ncbi:threonine--tRNA ligase [Spiroplasma poulsonii]|uniref:Threonine--tRNA ligase n=1 Tax=Spiroplasma poulsonii TaxID=2138 RepID=A0A2P6FCH8_9MOLU|nr:threonine--tRNA ligase [Spiroplasma poulsonii]KAF0851574.1 Threonine--tRNA ligase [Spiroplasma poulsonii]PQM31169.1 Threonine--tRNA ligase [Spiroplasma poulsonii]PWF96171.1 Threonine--tRNA ligase [Spiroplasma poulsonii]PWF98945.1 Threonine--tRNA ligase [Spiroplasma poulsonii]
MIKITLPDGQVRELAEPQTIQAIATSIAPSLEKAALGGVFANKVCHLDYLITTDGKLEIITDKSPLALSMINYTAGLITAKAITNLYPTVRIAQIAYQDDTFFVDIDVEPHLKETDISAIEAEITKLINNNITINSVCGSGTDAKKWYQNNEYFLATMSDQAVAEQCAYFVAEQLYLPNNYPVVPPKNIKVFKLWALAGAYWKDDAKNKMLQRITGGAHFSRELFEQLMLTYQERKERDHRKIGKDLEIFTFDQLVGPGLPIWLPNGMALKKVLQEYIREKEWEYDFIEVDTPVIGTSEMYKISGHWDHYQENMFAPMAQDNEISVLRPMACPHHIAVYNYKQRSYRYLPLRIAEHAILHRYETSGSLTGLERVRMMQLTDSHIFLRHDQLKEEFKRCFKLISEVLTTLNISVDYYSLSLRDPANKEKYYDDDQMWNHAEQMLQEALYDLKIPYVRMVGEAAFYGPKLDVQIKTALNHEITVSTLQFDFLLPQKFKLSYIDSNGEKAMPVMLHRGLIGTYERFIAILLEQSKGVLPFWLAPKQIVLMPVNNQHHLAYAEELHQQFKKLKLRTSIDDRDERLSYKIREAQVAKIPYQIVIGDQERDQKLITYRIYGQEEQTTVSFDKFIVLINDQLINKK